MLHYFTLASRHLFRRKLYTIIIILSLAIGFLCCGLLVSYLTSELNTDKYHSHEPNLYQMISNDPFEDNGSIAYIPPYLGEYLSKFPEATNTCAIGTLNKASFKVNGNTYSDAIVVMADASVFKTFDLPFASGTSPQTTLSDGVVISKSKAQQWFGDEDIIGKMITLQVNDTTRLLKIEGTLDAFPGNSHLQFDALIHHSVLTNLWAGGSFYITLRDGSNPIDLQAKINRDSLRPGLLGPASMTYSLIPIKESYFSAFNKMPHMRTQTKSFVWAGIVVCGMIFLMATFNFISLFLLSIQGRTKETGIKKTLGITFGRVVISALAEVTLYIGLAVGLSFAMAAVVLPYFNTMLHTTMSLDHLMNAETFAILASLIFLTGFVAVLISAIRQWKTLPVNLLKNAIDKITFSRSMFAVQFVVSITLCICAITIIKQTHFMTHAPLGFDRNIIQLSAPDPEYAAMLPALKQEILQHAGVQSAALSNGHPVSGNTVVRFDLEDGKFYSPFLFSGDEDYVKTLNLQILQGSSPLPGSDERLVNEAFVRYFNMKTPIGENIPGTKFKVSGVVKDFTCVSFKEAIQPAIIATGTSTSNMIINYSGSELSRTLSNIESSWRKIFPDHAFFYRILEADLEGKYKHELLFYRTVVTFSVVSMILSCFGLFALSWAVVQQRTKEMGIRKVLGASAADILVLLTSTFFKRILIAFAIAAPLGYYLMNQWLQSFANKIVLSPMFFLLAALIVFVVAFGTLSFQTIKAIRVNPVDELKRE